MLNVQAYGGDHFECLEHGQENFPNSDHSEYEYEYEYQYKYCLDLLQQGERTYFKDLCVNDSQFIETCM